MCNSAVVLCLSPRFHTTTALSFFRRVSTVLSAWFSLPAVSPTKRIATLPFTTVCLFADEALLRSQLSGPCVHELIEAQVGNRSVYFTAFACGTAF